MYGFGKLGSEATYICASPIRQALSFLTACVRSRYQIIEIQSGHDRFSMMWCSL